MKILNCPLNGARSISEFACLGEVKTLPAANAETAAWAEYVFLERNPAGPVREWWIHIATNYIFVVDRDTRTDEILATYRIGDPRMTQPALPDGEK
jgi:sarcosine oxidase, subunit delta